MATPMSRCDPVELPPAALAMRGEVRECVRENRHQIDPTKAKFNRGFNWAMRRRGRISRT